MKSKESHDSTKPKKSTGITVVTVIAAVLGGLLAKDCVSSNRSSPASQGFVIPSSKNPPISELLEHARSEMQASLPMNVDKATRLDSVKAGPGRRFTYVYTLLASSLDDMDVSSFEQGMRPNLVQGYRSAPGLKFFRDNDVDLIFDYSDRDGRHVASILIESKEAR